MPETRIAVIDLGTNTFHLLIAEAAEGATFLPVFKDRQYVRLAEDGIEKIGDAAFKRGMDTLLRFRHALDEYGIHRIQAFGTAALRTASNGAQFIREARQSAGIEIELIDGLEEAQLIFEGVRCAIPQLNARALIMDIGGGSVEFILSEGESVIRSHSFPIGVAVLFRDFHLSDPISVSETELLSNFLKSSLKPLEDTLRQYQPRTLVGSSGTFDTLLDLLEIPYRGQSASISPAQFEPLYASLIHSSLAERRSMPAIPEERVEMIVVAMVLIRHVMSMMQTDELLVSAYALKEGMIARVLRGNKP